MQKAKNANYSFNKDNLSSSHWEVTRTSDEVLSIQEGYGLSIHQ